MHRDRDRGLRARGGGGGGGGESESQRVPEAEEHTYHLIAMMIATITTKIVTVTLVTQPLIIMTPTTMTVIATCVTLSNYMYTLARLGNPNPDAQQEAEPLLYNCGRLIWTLIPASPGKSFLLPQIRRRGSFRPVER